LSSIFASTIAKIPFHRLKACPETLKQLSNPRDKYCSLLPQTGYLLVHEFPSGWKKIPSQVSCPNNRMSLYIGAYINGPVLFRLHAEVPSSKVYLADSLALAP